MRKYYIYALVALIIIVAVVAFVIYRHNNPTAKSEPKKDYYSVSDESVSVAFNISKNFTPIEKKELLALNPNYLYGYRAYQDPKTVCFVSQTKITKQGKITAVYLKDGTFAAIKKNYPSAKLNKWDTIKGQPAVFLEISYKDKGEDISQPEVILVSSKNTSFFFCQTLTKDKVKFPNDFTIFFSSVRSLK